MYRYPVIIDTRKLTGGGSTLTTSHEKVRASKRKIKYADRRSDTLTVDKNMHKCMESYEPRIGLKINII